jgi:hypothetical protein
MTEENYCPFKVPMQRLLHREMDGFIFTEMAGNITIIEARSAFQKVSKDIIYNPDIDPLTLGIYVKILALGKKWKLNVTGLATTLGISDDKVRKSIGKLIKTGYVSRSAAKGPNGLFAGWDYIVGEAPLTDLPKIGNTENTDDREIGNTENPQDIDIDDILEKELKRNKKSISKSKQIEGLDLPFASKSFADTWAILIQQPKWRKKSVSALQMSLKKLAAHTEAEAIEMMQKSIANDWQGVFEPDRKRTQQPRTKQDEFRYKVNDIWGMK